MKWPDALTEINYWFGLGNGCTRTSWWIVHERAIRTLIASALTQLEAETGTAIAAGVDPAILDRWRISVAELRPDGQTQQSCNWLQVILGR